MKSFMQFCECAKLEAFDLLPGLARKKYLELRTKAR